MTSTCCTATIPGRGRRLHRHPDPRHRRPDLSAVAGGPAVPGRDPDPPGGGARRADPREERRPGRLRVLRRALRLRDARRGSRPGRRGRLRAPRPGVDDAGGREACGVGVRRAHRRRKEPDEPRGGQGPARRRPDGRPDPPSDALWRSRGDARAAIRLDRRHRRLPPDDRGARGIRAPGRDGDARLRRRRLRGDHPAGRERGRRPDLGRRQQRPPVPAARPLDRGRRSAAARRRARLLPRRGEPPHGGHPPREQGGQRHRRAASPGPRGHRGARTRTRPSSRPTRRSRSTTARRSTD